MSEAPVADAAPPPKTLVATVAALYAKASVQRALAQQAIRWWHTFFRLSMPEDCIFHMNMAFAYETLRELALEGRDVSDMEKQLDETYENMFAHKIYSFDAEKLVDVMLVAEK